MAFYKLHIHLELFALSRLAALDTAAASPSIHWHSSRPAMARSTVQITLYSEIRAYKFKRCYLKTIMIYPVTPPFQTETPPNACYAFTSLVYLYSIPPFSISNLSISDPWDPIFQTPLLTRLAHDSVVPVMSLLILLVVPRGVNTDWELFEP
jgi:hypothetical protein